VVEDAARLADDIAKLEFDSLEIGIDPLAASFSNASSNRLRGAILSCLLAIYNSKYLTMPGRCERQMALEVRLWRETFSVYFCSKYNEYFFCFLFVVYTTEWQVVNYGTLRAMHCHLYGKNGIR